MQLPDFITKMLGFVEKSEANLTAAKDLATAKTRVAELEALSATDKAAAGTHDAAVKALQGQVAAKDQEITTLKAEVATEKKRATDTLAAQGLAPEQLPAATVTAPGNNGKESAWNQFSQMLEKDPVAAGRYYGEHAEAILKSRPKA